MQQPAPIPPLHVWQSLAGRRYEPRRNLFAFREHPAAALSRVAAPSAEPARRPATAMPELMMRLIGIAEESVGSETVRTAIIAAPSDLLLVKEGDPVMALYRVARISATDVDLAGVADGAIRHLRLESQH